MEPLRKNIVVYEYKNILITTFFIERSPPNPLGEGGTPKYPYINYMGMCLREGYGCQPV